MYWWEHICDWIGFYYTILDYTASRFMLLHLFGDCFVERNGTCWECEWIRSPMMWISCLLALYSSLCCCSCFQQLFCTMLFLQWYVLFHIFGISTTCTCKLINQFRFLPNMVPKIKYMLPPKKFQTWKFKI